MNKSAGALLQGGILGQVGSVARGRLGGAEEAKRRSESREEGSSFYPYGRPVGWRASSQVSMIPSFTTHDRQIITHKTHPEYALSEAGVVRAVESV